MEPTGSQSTYQGFCMSKNTREIAELSFEKSKALPTRDSSLGLSPELRVFAAFSM